MKKSITVLFLLVASLAFSQEINLDSGSKELLAIELDYVLKDEMLAKWYPLIIDYEEGGYFSNLDYQWKRMGKQDKMIVTQSRHIWTCSKMTDFYHDQTYLKYARHGFYFLKDKMWDKEMGGFYDLVKRDGTPVAKNGIIYKNAYGNAFAIYGLAAYFKESKDSSALELAKNTFYWLEKNSHDPVSSGYFQFLERDGKALKNGSNGIPPKDQNSSIHLLEAFAELYQVWPDPLVRERLQEMLHIVRDVIVQDGRTLQLFLDQQWAPVSFKDSARDVYLKNIYRDHISFGHDIETAFLLLEASEVLGLQNDALTLKIAKQMTDHAINKGLDKEKYGFFDGGYYFNGEDEISIVISSKGWWAQAEAMNSLLLMAQLFPDDSIRYVDHFIMQWQFIKEHLIDWHYGGWYRTSLDQEPESEHGQKADIWKANYHTVRSMMNCIKRLKYF